jgi:hypothetical protein
LRWRRSEVLLKPAIEGIIEVGLLPREDIMIDVLGALLIGFICGYGVRELIAHRRRAEYRRRHPEQFRSYTKDDVQ